MESTGLALLIFKYWLYPISTEHILRRVLNISYTANATVFHPVNQRQSSGSHSRDPFLYWPPHANGSPILLTVPPMKSQSEKCYSLSRVWLFLWPHRLFCPWDFPGTNTGAGCHFFLQGMFLTQGLSLGLPHCRQILHCLSHEAEVAPMEHSPLPSIPLLSTSLRWLK